MEDGVGSLEVGIPQIPIEVGDAAGGEEALVHDGTRRGGGDGEPFQTGLARRRLHPLAGQEQQALESFLLDGLVRRCHYHLFDGGHGLPGATAQCLRVYRHPPPGEHCHPFSP